MAGRVAAASLFLLLLLHGCPGTPRPVQLKYRAAGNSPEILAVYEPWFGHPGHISVGYSSHDPAELRRQMEDAKRMGISGFVVDWYGNRDPFNGETYTLMQPIAADEKFTIAMMYDETNVEDGATDEAIAEFTMFHDRYLTAAASGQEAYLTYLGRPVIFVFPKGGYTDWNKVRDATRRWNPAPLLIDENLPGKYADAFDGYYAWISPGSKGWAADGSNWGEDYLSNFYGTMATKYPDKIIVGGAWAQFNDSKASWGLNRHIAARCGQTFRDTFNFWRQYFPSGQVIPFMLVETWNDYEEGSDMEPGLPGCGGQPAPTSLEGEEETATGPR